jgi:hypothetical protein
MTLRPVLVCTAAAALAALVVGPVVGPGRSAGAAPHAGAGQHGRASAHRAAAPKPNRRTLAAARRHTPPPAVPRVPRLDARLQRPADPAAREAAVVLRGNRAQVEVALTKVHGRILARTADAISAVVPRTSFTALAASPGVAAVDQPVPAVETSATAESVTESAAGVWQNVGQTGAGVKVAIVDGGFADLAAEVAAGNLPAGTVINGDHCAQNDTTEHGTAVAEIVHQMAPDAQLFLYCIDDTVGFKAAEQELQTAGVKIVNSSLGFPGDSRGDGTGGADSAVATVHTARQAGILWIESAGNNGADHWGGTFTDADHDGLADLDGPSDEIDSVFVAPGGSALLVLQWNQWPASSAPVTLEAFGWQCTDDPCNQQNETPINSGTPVQAPHTAGDTPVDGIMLTNNSAFEQEWDVAVELGSGTPAVHYDLSYWDSVSASYLSSIDPARSASGSITEPASSPDALAVGAAYWNGHGLEPFSSQGPTIDGRTKPDLTGFDGVTSNLPEFADGFYGTSAAAPNVAGAAALASAATPGLDAAQLEDFLEQRANLGAPANPPTDQLGYGLVSLGAPPTAYGYHALPTPQRVVNGRLLGAGQAATLSIPAGVVPAGTAAVALNMTAVLKTGTGSYVSLFRPGSTWVDTSNLYVSSTDPQTEVLAVQSLAGQAVAVRNSAGSVQVYLDVLGYFGGPDATSRYTPVTGVRLLNTATTLGNHHRRLNNGESIQIDAGSSVPAAATSVAVNVMAYNPTGAGYLTASGGAPSVSTLRYYNRSRANLAITPLSQHKFRLTLSGLPSDAVVDLVGYFSDTAGASFVPVPTPVRIGSTLTGNGLPRRALGATTTAFQGAGRFTVPYGAKALISTVLVLPVSGGNYLTVYPDATRPPLVSTLAFSSGRRVSNAVMGGLNAGGLTKIENTSGSVNVAIDLSGYFI